MNTKQIAEEARNEIRSYFNKPYYPNEHENDKVLLIIQAAIEKVDEQWRERFRKFEKIEEKFGPASQRAAHASEPTNQLAAKAASSMVAAGYVKREHEQAISERIQAAIEKATEPLYKLLDEQGARNWGISRAAHAREPSDQIAAAAERLRYECETTEDPNSGFAKDIMTLVEFAESRAAHASEERTE